ncbi:hypothetical protein HDU67_001118, partial [Dinochytrium kinnereticum]
MTYQRHLFKSFSEKPSTITTADGRQQLKAEGSGDIELECELGEPGSASNVTKFILKDVLYVPHLARNLISLGMARKKGLDIFPERNGYALRSTNSKQSETIARFTRPETR